jgi:hypothetical protein
MQGKAMERIGEISERVVGDLAERTGRTTPKLDREGVFFNLPDAQYHDDDALGSTDLKRLLRSAPDFWWHSKFNPLRKPEEESTLSPALIFGRAVHKCVLEGRGFFEAHYAPTDFAGNLRAGKEERAEITEAGKVPLKREDYERILVASQFIRANPHLSEAFAGGYPEVSVFWEEDGIRFKARFDYLKLRAITDLKSIRNSRGIDFVEACRRRFADDRFDLQAEHYCHAREQIAGLMEKGLVFGDYDPDWLRKAAHEDPFAFVFVWWQADDAPITWACSLSRGSPILKAGRSGIEAAVHRYRSFMNQFGPDQAWVLTEPVSELDSEELPPWFWRAA